MLRRLDKKVRGGLVSNRDPENVVFGTLPQEQDKFIFDDVSFLLIMAFADRSLFDFNTLADL